MESEYVIVKDNSKAHDNPDRPKEQSYSWDRSNDGYSKITYKEDFHFEASDYSDAMLHFGWFISGRRRQK